MAENKVTLTISFDEDADSSLHVVALLDDKLNVDSRGETKTSFGPGDAPYFLVHCDPKLAVRSIACSSGSATGGRLETREATTEIDVGDGDDETTDLEYIPSGNVSGKWYGNQPTMTRNGRTITWSGTRPAAGELSYQYQAYSYKYTPPAWEKKWRTHIVVHMTAAK